MNTPTVHHDDPCDESGALAGPYKIRLVPDDQAESPREEDCNIDVMVCWHRRSNLGDRQPNENEHRALSSRKRGGRAPNFAVLERYLRRFHDVAIVLPLSLYEHSGMTMWCGNGTSAWDSQGFDSGPVGFIYMTRTAMTENFGTEPQAVKLWTKSPLLRGKAKLEEKILTPLERAERCLRSSVESYDQFLKGEIYGFIVEDINGEHIDSCWGFYGDDPDENGMSDHWDDATKALYKQKGFQE